MVYLNNLTCLSKTKIRLHLYPVISRNIPKRTKSSISLSDVDLPVENAVTTSWLSVTR